VIQINEQSLPDELVRLSAYAPNKFVKNDVKNSSALSQRFIAFCFVTGLHGLFLWWLDTELALNRKSFSQEVITVLEFIDKKSIEILPDMQVEKPTQQVEVRKTTNIKLQSPVKIVSNSKAQVKTKASQPLKIYDDTGRIVLPVDFVEKYDENNLASRRFDFQNPDLELAGTWLKRPPAIDFDPTRFDQAWKPDQDILNELLDKAVEKTTKEIKIPVPGNPTVKLVCKVSVLALGGGCGFVPNGGYGRVIPDDEDDPKTLSPEEDKQCQAWWEKINDTRNQHEWFKTKDLYELTCKKPLAKEKIKAR
jgi:hypothetical protein